MFGLRSQARCCGYLGTADPAGGHSGMGSKFEDLDKVEHPVLRLSKSTHKL